MLVRSTYQHPIAIFATVAFAATAFCGFCQNNSCDAFVAPVTTTPHNGHAIVGPTRIDSANAKTTATRSRCRHGPLFYNIYDNWRSDAVVDKMHLDEENVLACLEEFVQSDYGSTMFGCHDRAAQVGITGSIEFVEICGPEVTLSLKGRFWHKRSTVLGRAAMWLNARIPEITDVMVADIEDLKDFEEILDENSGDVLFRKDKRSEDFNGDRGTMEYQGLDPDARGPFPASPMGSGGSMINPA